MEQWIGSVHSKMAWRTHFFFFFGVYHVLEKSSSYIYLSQNENSHADWCNYEHITEEYTVQINSEILFDRKSQVKTKVEDVKEMWVISAGRAQNTVYEGHRK